MAKRKGSKKKSKASEKRASARRTTTGDSSQIVSTGSEDEVTDITPSPKIITTNEEATLIAASDNKTIELACVVEEPTTNSLSSKNKKEALAFLYAPPSSIGQDEELRIKQELINDVNNISIENGQLSPLSTSYLSTTEATPDGETPSIKIKNEKNENKFAFLPIGTTQETEYNRTSEHDQEALAPVAQEPSTESLQTRRTSATTSLEVSSVKETSCIAEENHTKEGGQSQYGCNSAFEMKIKQELLDEYNCTSVTPSSESTITGVSEVQSRPNDIQNSADASISASSGSIQSVHIEKQETPAPNDSNFHQFLSPRNVPNNSDNIEKMIMSSSTHSDLLNGGSIPQSEVQPLIDTQKFAAILSTIEQNSELLAEAINSPVISELANTSNARLPHTICSEIMKSEQDLPQGIRNNEEMEVDEISSGSTIISSYPDDLASPTLNLNALADESSNTNCGILEIMKEEITRAPGVICTTTALVTSDNAASGNAISENDGSQPPVITNTVAPSCLNHFILNWELFADSANSENCAVDIDFFAELALYLRTLGYKRSRVDNAEDFCKCAMKQYISNNELSNSDHLVLGKLFPKTGTEHSIPSLNHIEKAFLNFLASLNLPMECFEESPEVNAVKMERNDSTAEMESDNVAKMEIDDNVAKMETSGDVANMETSGDVANMETSGDVANMETSGDVANMESSANVANMETSSNVANMETSSNVANMDTHSNVANMETRDVIETTEIRSENMNSNLDRKIEQHIIESEEEVQPSLPNHQGSTLGFNLLDIANQLSTETLQGIIKIAYSQPSANLQPSKSNMESNLLTEMPIVENSFSHDNSILPSKVSSAVFTTDAVLNDTSMNIGHMSNNVHSDSDESCRDDSRLGNSDDSDATTKTPSLGDESSPKRSPDVNLKKKSNDQSPEHVPKKKSRYEMIMDRKKLEEAQQLTDSERRNEAKGGDISSKSTNSRNNDILIFQPMPRHLALPQKRKLSSSGNEDNEKDRGKDKPKENKIKHFMLSKKKDGSTVHQSKNKDIANKNEKSNLSSFTEMGTGTRFKNRNSSLFEDVTKVAQQPIPCRQKPVRQKPARSNVNQLTMEELHSQIDTASITVPEAKKKLSLKDYQQRRATQLPLPLPPMHRELLQSPPPRSLALSIQSSHGDYPVQDPRHARSQAIDSAQSLTYIRYPQNLMTESESTSSTDFMKNPVQYPISGINYSLWNNMATQFGNNHISPVMSPCSSSRTISPLYPKENSPSYNPVLPPRPHTPLSDDMDLCSPEPTILQTSTLGRFTSHVHSLSSSLLRRDPRRLSTSPHSATASPPISSKASMPRDGNTSNQKYNDPYEVNLLPSGIQQSIGKTVIPPMDALMLVLSWVPNWLKEADRADKTERPPIFGKGNVTLRKNLNFQYSDNTEYFNAVFPLMLFDLFFRMHDMHKSFSKDTNSKIYELDIVQDTKVGDMVEIQGKMLLPKKPMPTIEGQLAVVTFNLICGRKRDVFAYIANQKIYVDNPNSSNNQEMLYLYIKIMFSLQNVNKSAKISVFPFYPLSKVLSQIQALEYIDVSPLGNVILNPSLPSCSRLILERTGALKDSVSTISRTVEKIKNSISLDNPKDARILVVDSPVGTDLMNTIITLIEDVKNMETETEKHRILICCRSLKELTHIALRLLGVGGKNSSCPNISTMLLLKAKGVADSELRKLTLESQMYHHTRLTNRLSTSHEPHSEEEMELDAQKHVLRNSDVILSHIPQCYDSGIESLFGEDKLFQFSFCIMNEAYNYTEPEAMLPLLYGIKKIILAGDPQEKPRVVSSISAEYNYYRSLPSRLGKKN